MRMVGTVAFDVARPPGATAVALACDLSAAAVEATERLRHVARTVVRGVAAVLRARGPVVAALVTSFRAMPDTVVRGGRVAPRGRHVTPSRSRRAGRPPAPADAHHQAP